MAHTKSQGAVKGNRDSVSKRLGIKASGGSAVSAGSILVRQKGTQFHAGNGVSMGSDHTLFALRTGTVAFKNIRGKKIVEVMNG